MSEATKTPYLSIEGVAAELDCSTRNVYKLIQAGKLPSVVKRSERKTLVPRWSLEAYQRRINGESSSPEPLTIDADALMKQFADLTGGISPQQFYLAFKSGRVADTSENMSLLVKAIALGAGSDTSSIPVENEPWAAAAFLTAHQ